MAWHVSSIRQALLCSVAAVLMLTLFGVSVGSAQIVRASGGGGNTWTVNNNGDNGITTCTANSGASGPACQLRDALIKAQYDDTIQFSVTGTIYIGATLAVATRVHIVGPGAAILTIDGSKFKNSIFAINSGASASFYGLKLGPAGSSTASGGAINNAGALGITSCVFFGDVADNGGAIYSSGTTLTISASTFSDNATLNDGGAIYSSGATLTISASTFSGNYATGGNAGAIFSSGPSVTISASTFSANVTSYYGGAIYNYSGTLSIDHSTLSGNSGELGGAIFNGNASLIDYDNSYSGNSATSNSMVSYGGAIYNYGTASISNDTLAGNNIICAGGGYGGAIYNHGRLTVGNSTVSSNTAGSGSSGYGGGIYSDGTNTTVYSSTVSGNSAKSGGGIGFYFASGRVFSLGSSIVAKNTATYDPDINIGNGAGTFTSLGYNLIGNIGFAILTSSTGDQIGSPSSPIDPLLFPLNTYGYLPAYPNQTMALNVGSPAIGKGSCSLASPAAPVTTDERGIARKIPCDVGAYDMTTSAIDTIGIFRNGTFYLRLHNSTGFADLTVAFNRAAKPYPIVGDWTGGGFDAVGIYDQSNGLFSLCKVNNTAGCASASNLIQLVLGNPGDIPLSGRWLTGAATDGAGVFRPSNGLIYLKNALTTGFANDTMVLGIPGDIGLAGDWNDKGSDSPGVYRPSGSVFYASNKVCNCQVFADYQAVYGVSGDSPVVGDWIGQSSFGIGLFRATNGYTYLKNALATGFADITFVYGIAGDVPVAGHWQAVYPPQPPRSEGTLVGPPPVLVAPTLPTVLPSVVVPVTPGANPKTGLGD